MLKAPGTRSNLTLITSGISSAFMIVILVLGHLVVGLQLFAWLTDRSGMQGLSEFTMLPMWSLWLAVALALLMDIWIVISARKERLKKTQR